MPTLYVRTGCSFCKKVLDTAESLGLSLEEKNVADEAVLAELVVRGGKKQVPYLTDEEFGVSLYGSDAIAEYLIRRCNGQPNVCISDFT
jgi:glutaredoxin